MNKMTSTNRRVSTLGRIAFVALSAAAPACTGDAGPVGDKGADGTNGKDGKDGNDGMTGKDGTSAIVDQRLSATDKAFVAIGGKDAVMKLDSLTMSIAGHSWIKDEGFTPDVAATDVGTFTLSMTYDIKARNLRNDYERNITFIGVAKTTFSEYIRDNLGYIGGTESILGQPSGNMTSDRWASTLKHQRLLNPHLLLRDVAADPTLATDAGVALLDGSVHHLVKINDKHPVTLWVSSQTGTIDKLATLENDWLQRDIEVDVFFTGWKPADNGLNFPSDAYIAKGGVIVHAEHRNSVKVNAAIDPTIFNFPAGATPKFDQALADLGDTGHEYGQDYASAGVPLDGQQVFVNSTMLSPNVYHLTGGSHHTMVVEQTNGVVVIEAPLYEARSQAVINWIKANLPGKPITHVVSTHFHSDHASGLRTFVAAGATIVAGKAAAPFYEKIFKASSTVLPDPLAVTPKAAKIIVVPDGGSYSMDDPANPVVAYQVDNPHADGMLIGYLPVQKIAFTSDLYSPGFPVAPPGLPGAVALFDAIESTYKLPVVSIAGGHGVGAVPYEVYKTAIGK